MKRILITIRVFAVILSVVILSTFYHLPPAFANNVAQQFWLPGTADGSCHFQFISLTLMQGGGVSGTIVASNPIYVVVLNSTDKQSIPSDPNACTDLTTMGLLNSGATTNYDLAFTAPYTAAENAPFWVMFANVGSADALVTINLTTT